MSSFPKVFVCLPAVLRISDLCLSLPVMLLYFSDMIWVIFLYRLSLPRTRLTGLGWQGREQRLGGAHQGKKTVHMPSGKYSAFLCRQVNRTHKLSPGGLFYLVNLLQRFSFIVIPL